MTHDPSLYGERIADLYDELFPAVADDAPIVSRLAALARGGRVLELGIGTGRIALPLARRGVEIEGVDASESMVARMRGKPGGDRIRVTMGDFARVLPAGPFSLVFVAFNTFFGLLTQDDQARCFREVAARLDPKGAFLLECFVPDVARFDRGQRVSAVRVAVDVTDLDVAVHDPVNQRIDTQHVRLRESGTRLVPIHLRYAWPSELDLMARLAGLSLRERHGGWGGERYTGAGTHVSVYARADDGPRPGNAPST